MRQNDLAGSVQSVELTDDFNQKRTKNGETVPIVNGRRSGLRPALESNEEGINSAIRMKYRGKGMRALRSTFSHELKHANDYFYGTAQDAYRRFGGNFDKTRVWLEMRGVQGNLQFRFRHQDYLNTYNLWLNDFNKR